MRTYAWLFGIACLAIVAVSPAGARTPSMDDIYSMIVDQHSMLQDQQKRIEALEQALGLQKQEINTLRQRATNAESELEQSRKELRSIVIPSGERLAALPGQQLASAPALAQLPPREPQSRFNATLQSLYLTAYSDSFKYLNGQATGDGPQYVSQEFEPGMELRVAYALNNEWSLGGGVRHIQGRSRERHTVGGNQAAFFDVGADISDVLDAQPGETVYAESKYRLWSADLDARYGFGSQGQFGFISGVRYASLKRGLDVRDTTDFSDNEANFFGVGPKLGISGDIGLGRGFRVSALTSGTLLVGRSEVLAYSNCGCDPNNEDYRQNREFRAVPVFDGRLGLGYDYAPRGSQGFGLGFEGGVLGQHWMNLQDFVNQGTGTFLGIGTPMIADTTMTFFGPYLSMKMWW